MWQFQYGLSLIESFFVNHHACAVLQNFYITTSNKNALFGTQEMIVLRTRTFLCTCFFRESYIWHFPSYYLTTFFTIGNWRFWFWLHISLVIIVLFFYVPKCITSVVSLNCKFLKVFSFHNPWKNWASPAFGPYLECACTKTLRQLLIWLQ